MVTNYCNEDGTPTENSWLIMNIRPDLLISLLQFDLFTDNGLFPAALVRIPFSDCHTGLSKRERYKCSDPGHSIIH